MNRKYIMGFAAGVMALSLVLSGCGNKTKEDTTKTKVEQKSEEKETIDTLEFSTKTIFDKDIDNKIFKDYKLTMINLWATSCKPCIAEMPDLQKVYEDVKSKGVNIIGVVADVRDEKDTEYKDIAKAIVKETGVKYDNLIADKNLAIYFSEITQAVPTTIFVDINGKVVGEPVIGSREKEEYKLIIEERLKAVK